MKCEEVIAIIGVIYKKFGNHVVGLCTSIKLKSVKGAHNPVVHVVRIIAFCSSGYDLCG